VSRVIVPQSQIGTGAVATRSARARRVWGGLSTFQKVIFAAFLVILFLAAFGPMLAPFSTVEADPPQRLMPPGAKHLFGTDENGIDVLSRLLAAPRTDVTIALVATALSVAIGAGLGVFAGFFEGSTRRWLHWATEIGLRFLDILQAFPVFILAMVLVAVRGTGPMNVLFAVAFVSYAPRCFRCASDPSPRRRARSEIPISASAFDICCRTPGPTYWCRCR
jgi:ABC-type dipeptide/oligopeptide/nickel transport system permease subunit